MLPLVWGVFRVYAPYIVFPFAVIIGTIGYNLETILTKDNTLGAKQIAIIGDQRSDRLLEQMDRSDPTQVESLKKHSFVAKSIFEANVSQKTTNAQNN